jgi:hypothetical protein
MGFNFPDAPTPGQVFGNYTWDAATGAWKLTAGGTGAPPSTVNPKPLGPVAPGIATPYSREDHVHPIDATVRYDTPQTLTDDVGTTVGQKTQGRKNIYAAPFDAMAYSGMQINGSMEVSQELGNAGRTSTGYILDGWRFTNSTTASVAAAQVPGGTNPGLPNFINSPVSAAQATLTTTQAATVFQFIEGYRIARMAWGTLNAQPMTIGFWTAHNRTGTYSVAVRNGTDDRSYVTTYTQNASSTWEYKTVTIPGDTTGTWASNNNIGMLIQFAMACGPTYTAPAANAWSGGFYIVAPGQVNAVAATSDIFRITGVVVLPGIEAPSAARSPLIMRPYDQELVTCKRYWEKSYPYAVAVGSVTANGSMFSTAGTPYWLNASSFQCSEKRAVPIVTLYSPNTGSSGMAAEANLGNTFVADRAISAANVSEKTFQALGAGTMTPGNLIRLHWTADARL